MALVTQGRSDVYINEINMSTIMTGASTVQAGLVVVSKKGSPELRHFTSYDRFREHYGDADPTVSMTGYTARDYFREGNSLYAVRAVGPNAKWSAVALIRSNAGSISLKPVTSGIVDPQMPEWNDIAGAGEQVVGVFWPQTGQGSHGDSLRIELATQDAATPTNLQGTTETGIGGSIVAGNYTYVISATGQNGETLASAPLNIVVAGGVTNATNILTWDLMPNAYSYKIYGRTSAGIGLLSEIGQGTNTFADNGILTPDINQQPITNPSLVSAPSPIFTVIVYDTTISNSNPIETWDVSFYGGSDGTGATTEIEERINSFSLNIGYTSNIESILATVQPNAYPATNMAGGDSGGPVTSYNIAQVWQRNFSKRDVVPTNVFINGGIADPIVQRAIDSLAQQRGDNTGLLDTPSNQQRYQQLINYRNVTLNLNSTYSGLFGPDVLQPDSNLERNVFTPFSGWAAALAARTARVANQSFSIAGLNRGILDILGTRHNFEIEEMNALSDAGINFPRTFLGAGTALWEQKTLAPTNRPSALTWLSVRFLANVIKTSMYNYGLYYLQEPNDEFTIRGILKTYDAYLTQWVQARGLYDYELVSDSRNNTIDMEIAGTRRILIVLYPTIPIHKLQLDFSITKRSVTVDEVLLTVGNV